MMTLTLDNFLRSYPDLVKVDNYKDKVNPVDGVTYPLIGEVPDYIEAEVLGNIAAYLKRLPKNPTMFLRSSPKGVHCPHIIHTDNSMGEYSLMLYMGSEGGTGFARHIETGMDSAPDNDDLLQKAIEDQNNIAKWCIYDMAPMRENRAVIFDAHRFHCALPIGGYDGRKVLTCFFS